MQSVSLTLITSKPLPYLSDSVLVMTIIPTGVLENARYEQRDFKIQHFSCLASSQRPYMARPHHAYRMISNGQPDCQKETAVKLSPNVVFLKTTKADRSCCSTYLISSP